MKKQLLLLVMMMLPMVASADTVYIFSNGIYYKLNTDDFVAEVTTIYYSYDNSNVYTGSIVIPNSVVTDDHVTYSVTSIDNDAFSGCYGLTSITIPNSVTSIGEDAFSGCAGLTSITIPNSVTSIGEGAFRYCTGLTSINIPNSVMSIGEDAFSGCRGLTSIAIPNSVTSIGERAFSGCTGLNSIKVDAGNTIYDSRDNCNAIIETASNTLLLGCNNTIVPNSVTNIGERAFSGCTGLTSITIPNSVTSIGDYAFGGTALTSITIPNSVTSIGDRPFYNCRDLTSVNISCEVIDNWLNGIATLTEITLGEGVKIVKENAFKGCTNIKTIDIGSTITSIEARAFSGTDKLTDVTCRATTVPETDRTAFENSYPNYATLHVPAVSQTAYKETAPWSEFKKNIAIIQDLPDGAEQCATPTISYQNGKLSFACITEGVEYQYQITDNDIRSGAGTEVSLDATYHISVYATKKGYKDSEIASAALCWIDQKPATEGITNGVAHVSANAVLIQSVGGMLSVSGVPTGTAINVYDLSGKMTGSAKSSSGTTTIATTLRSGEIGVLKIGDKSVKYVVK